MARVSKEIEEQIYHLEILRAHPEDVESLRELLMFESSLHRESSDLSLENLEYRLERIVRLIGIEGLKKNLEIFFEVVENSYKKEPYKTRGFALCIFKSISDLSGPIALDFFSNLRENLVDVRIRKSALLCSKREGRILLQLDLLDTIEDSDEREFERMIALQEICESIFSKNFEKIEVICRDSSGVGSVQRLHDCLKELRVFEENFQVFDLVNFEEFDLVEDIIDKLKEECSEDFEEDSIFGISDFEQGVLEDDLNNLPLYSLDDRVRVEIMENQDIDNVIQSINSVIKNEICGSRRAVEVILSGMRVFGGQHPELAIRMLNELGLDEKSDERIKRHAARAYEKLGKLDEASRILQGCLQPSSNNLLDRIEVLSNWIENGYDLDFVDYSTDETIPVHGRLMYCVHSSFLS